jgi:hypothetical protein
MTTTLRGGLSLVVLVTLLVLQNAILGKFEIDDSVEERLLTIINHSLHGSVQSEEITWTTHEEEVLNLLVFLSRAWDSLLSSIVSLNSNDVCEDEHAELSQKILS